MDKINWTMKIICTFILVINLIVNTGVLSDGLVRKIRNVGAVHDGFNEEDVVQYLNELEPKYSEACNKQMEARWAYTTNVNNETEIESIEATNIFAKFQASVQTEIRNNFNSSFWDSLSDPVKRELKYLSIQGPGVMPEEDIEKMNELTSKMESLYASARVCEYKNPLNCQLELNPDIEGKLKSTTDYDELAYYWTEWHNAMSDAVKPSDYTQFTEYQNQMAKANGYNDMVELSLQYYDNGMSGWTAADFKEEMHSIWRELRPFYQKLHAYVRMKLRTNPQYNSKIKKYGYIPAHLMGNMWSQQWTHLENTTKPYPNAPSVDATEAMIKKGYTVDEMFRVSDKFFEDMGLEKMTDIFWNKTMFTKPTDGRKVVCHASAEDMCLGKNSKDFRVKMCTNINMDDLLTVHHEMGHIEYYMQYTDKPYIFRTGANPGFHEAIGDALALAVLTPKHLECVLELDLGLDIDCTPTSTSNTKSTLKSAQKEIDLNFLYRMALDKFAFFPFAISMDSWRWEVIEGKIPESQYNIRWWEIRQENQGIIPPSPRDSNRFDPAAKYHIVANVEYIRYFVSFILQFQFYEEMCITAGQYDPQNIDQPLHQCDFTGNKTAGKMFGEMMKLGFSKPWPEALNILTKGKGLSPSSLLAYFKPLFDELDEKLKLANETPCFGRDCEKFAKSYVEEKYEIEASSLCNNASLSRWAYQTNLTNADAEAALIASNLAYAGFKNKEWKETISQFDSETFDDTSLTKRQLKFLNAIGVAALPHDKLEQYNKILSKMSKIYGTAKVCPYIKQNCDVETEGLPLEPDLEHILATSKNYNEMAYYWKGWRDHTGKLMRADYNQYVDLSNEAALANGYADMGEFWLHRYESETFKQDMEYLWKDVKGIYQDLHAYVRHRLSDVYPQIALGDVPLPAHILGNMWAQNWGNVYKYVLPYPNAPIFDVTEKLQQAYSDNETAAYSLFDVANGFFTSINLLDMKMAYGSKSMIRKPFGREVICHASAWDFCDGEDYRVKMCTNVDMKSFITIHHELGHIQYYLQYKHLNITLRASANPGFHEAIGDVIALSVATPAHMYKLGLLEQNKSTSESTINFLMKTALEKIAFLPFGFLIDSYRWRIFDGQIPRQNLTYNWLKMSMEYQGVHPPFKRSDLELDFDPGAKYHVPADSAYIGYFFSFILQFQIHKELCKEAGLYDPPSKPLHECDIYKNVAAGKKFESILKSGGSRRWQDLLEEITGQRKLDASALLEYFKPLQEFFKIQQATLKYQVGWDINSFEDYFGEGPLLPTSEYTTKGTTSNEIISPSSSLAASESTESSLDESVSSSNIVAIIVGSVLGVAVLVIVIGYIVQTKLRKRTLSVI